VDEIWRRRVGEGGCDKRGEPESHRIDMAPHVDCNNLFP
jgi:hypothetical protein